MEKEKFFDLDVLQTDDGLFCSVADIVNYLELHKEELSQFTGHIDKSDLMEFLTCMINNLNQL